MSKSSYLILALIIAIVSLGIVNKPKCVYYSIHLVNKDFLICDWNNNCNIDDDFSYPFVIDIQKDKKKIIANIIPFEFYNNTIDSNYYNIIDFEVLEYKKNKVFRNKKLKKYNAKQVVKVIIPDIKKYLIFFTLYKKNYVIKFINAKC